MAVNNFKQGKASQVDCTSSILLMGLGGIMGILCGVFGLEAASSIPLMNPVEDVISIAGFILAILALSRTVHIIQAENCVEYAKP